MDASSISLALHGAPIIASFCKVSSGSELDLFSTITEKDSSALVFKALGDFDVVVFAGATCSKIPTTLSESTGAISACRKVSSHRITAGEYQTPDLLPWLQNSTVVGFVLLELNKWIYTYQPPSITVSTFISDFYENSKWDADSTAFVAGFGQSELYAFIRADNFDDLFKFTNHLRSVKFKDILPEKNLPKGLYESSVFAATHSVPLISYPEVITEPGYKKIKGKVSAEILVKCPPGMESKVCNSLSFSDSTVQSMFGGTDFSLRLKDQISSSSLIKTLMDFRAKWKNFNPALIDTSTNIFGSADFVPYTGGSPLLETISEYPSTSSRFAEEKPFISSRINSLAHRIRSHLNTRSSMPAVLTLACIPPRLIGETQRFVARQDGEDDREASPESTIIAMLDSAEMALAQRIGNSFSAARSSAFLPDTFGDGVLAAILAIEAFVDFVYEKFFSSYTKELGYSEEFISEAPPKEEEDQYESQLEQHCGEPGSWKGYVYFSDTSGFQYHHFDVLSLPLEAVSSPANTGVNWLTLTHEISHSIFTILGVDKARSDVIEESVKRVLGDSGSGLEAKEFARIRDVHFELFANWFDYYHFYNRDLKFYFQCIWSSWATVPVVYSDVTEYIFRSFMIFLLSDVERYQGELLLGREDSYLADQWLEFKEVLTPCISLLNETHDLENDYKAVFDLVKVFGGPFSTIVSKYADDAFRKTINAPYENLESHVSIVMGGGVIDDEIENPLMFLVQCRKKFPELPLEQAAIASSAVMFSLRNSAEFME